jgi:dihydrofolate reductase
MERSNMTSKSIVFIACSLDGYIADRDGGLDWLHDISNPDNNDMGYGALMDEVDAILMGRVTFETVLGFGIEWPYAKPVIVLSRSLKKVPSALADRVSLLEGRPSVVLEEVHAMGHHKLYIDGGTTIQQFLQEDLIDEMRITRIPILLGGGFSLFDDLDAPLKWTHVGTEVYHDEVVQSRYRRKR